MSEKKEKYLNYNYFVHYKYKVGDTLDGYGSSSIIRPKPVTSWNDIEQLKEVLKEANFKESKFKDIQIVIVNYKLMNSGE